MVKHCNKCQQDSPTPPAAPLHPCSRPSHPCPRLNVDFAGLMEGNMFIDAYWKWLEVLFSMTTVKCASFARVGIPKSLVSNNGFQFTTAEYHQFCQQNGIHHIKFAPCHSWIGRESSPGVQERYEEINSKHY